VNIERADRLKKLPPYLFADLRRRIREAKEKGKDVITLGIGDPDQPTPDPVVDELVRAVRDVNDPDRHRYGCDAPVTELTDEIIRFYKRWFGVSLTKENVCVTMGSKDEIARFPMAYMNPGDIGIAPEPGYPTYNIGHVFAGGSTYFMPLLPSNHFLPDLEAIPVDVREKAKLLWVNYPNNPTTATCEAGFYETLVGFGKKYNTIIASDQAYALNCYEGYRSPSLLSAKGAFDVGVEFFSFSKCFNMTGWRLGFVVGNPELVNALATVKSNVENGTLRGIQFAGIKALQTADETLPKINAVYQRRRDRVVETLNTLGWQLEKPKATMYIWAPVPKRFNGDSLGFALNLFEKTGVVVTPGMGFGPSGKGYFRISLTYPDAVLEKAMQRLATMLD
jgi:LL-diaminopimelate aminotransferase